MTLGKKLVGMTTAIVLCAPIMATHARDTIQIVGSSTVYPFATVVAEKLGKQPNLNTPVIESTGTGGGMKLFCAGLGVGTPDFTNASRAIKSSEKELCAKNGVATLRVLLHRPMTLCAIEFRPHVGMLHDHAPTL